MGVTIANQKRKNSFKRSVIRSSLVKNPLMGGMPAKDKNAISKKRFWMVFLEERRSRFVESGCWGFERTVEKRRQSAML